jgi:large subunit ribosomal protein L22
MQITASQQNTRQAPRKVRLVANQVRKLSLEKALEQLAVIERRSTTVVLKTIRQAIANATHNHGVAVTELTLKTILVTEGPRYRRFQAVSRGRAHGIIKRTSNVLVVLEAPDNVGLSKPAAKAQPAPARKASDDSAAITQSAPTTQDLSKAASMQERTSKKTAAQASSKQVRSTARPKKGAK